MSKITAEHLQRSACVYIRQSTPDQLVHNLESQRRQYGLADRAKQLGWTIVEIIGCCCRCSGRLLCRFLGRLHDAPSTRADVRRPSNLHSNGQQVGATLTASGPE